MKRFTILLIIAIFSISVFAQQEKYSKVKVLTGESGIQLLAEAGFDVTEGIYKKGVFLISDFSENDLIKINELGLDYEILIEDVAKFYEERNIGLSTDIDDYKDAGDYEVPENFDFGSMSGHATYDEIVTHLDNMVNLFPDLITAKESLGLSIEGRELWMVKISDNPNINEEEPEVLYNSLHHAREPAGVMTLLFYMYYLLENYETDPFINTLVNNYEMYFVPVVNPDGYVYNQTIAPNGGGMWRKNRRNNGGGSFGVDPNRNYGYMWGLNNQGSSPDPWDETYRGTAPFSEPEIAAVRDFCEAHEFRIALNYHTYSNLLLYTWGYTAEPCEDDDILEAYAALMTTDSHYTYGPGATAIYETNGGSDDWMYGEQTTKDKIFAYTPELGGSDDDFWCPINRIIPIAQENMIQNILAAAFSGIFCDVKVNTSIITNENSGYLNYDATRLGLKDGGTFTVSIEPISDVIVSTGDPKVYAGMEILETITDSIEYTLLPWVPNCTLIQFLLSVDNGDFVLTDTINKIFGEPVVLYEDDCNTLTNWVSPNWDVTTLSYHSPTGSITDSPGGNYPNNHTSAAIFNGEVDLGTACYAELKFWGKWEIEQGWDYVQLMISTNGGTSWTPLEGKYTVTGNSNQAQGEPLYDGFQTDWVQEEIDLVDYIGNNVSFRFMLKTDTYVTEDGFYFDDFEVIIVEEATTGEDNIPGLPNNILLSNPIPNPAKGDVRFNISVSGSQTLEFIVYNAAGQKVYTTDVNENTQKIAVKVNEWEAGIYYYRLEGSELQTEAKKLVIIH